MIANTILKRAALGTALAALCAAGTVPVATGSAFAAPAVKPSGETLLSVGTGRLVNLSSPISDVFVANEAVADVQVRSATQIYVFGKAAGETSVFATNRAGKILFSSNVRVGQNIASVGEMLRLAMPEAQVQATPMNGMILLTGTVAAPTDVEEAGRLVQAFVGDNVKVVSRLKTATPLQVMLQVKIAEVTRSVIKDIGFNMLTRDQSGGFLFGISRGRDVGTIQDRVSGTLIDPSTGNPLVIGTDFKKTNPTGATTLNFMGRLFGLDILSALDLAENDGKVLTLAEPNLTALSGETASFLAGGEFPIAASNGINGTSIEFKQYGVSLAFTPTVLEGGRISMRVRPEVSELSSEGAIRLNGFQVPALSTRRAETTVELGSGQSFMIGGLMRNSTSNSVEKAPWLGDIPILGALFRSTGFRKNETELVIVVTPYLVKPVNAGEIALPTDGYRTANEAQRFLVDQNQDSRTGEQRPGPVHVAPRTVAPGIGAVGSAVVPSAPSPARPTQRAASSSAKPGFSF
ncbi:type II and III secretion system protein family protein [Sphingosinicella sp. LY1275]|uniref:type II and III secretion system protein family protein n=1 Tax=Sphingosinicella sp. LY1275 TaxID=3095379 RepID=UPI002ADEA621|nr:type II and III secretion system protein family protein [Sphingosinicella sp. LY1275]MEA1013659.1 type II and III secretion system protein family protein [Sphingosinicella sp. LY1275]